MQPYRQNNRIGLCGALIALAFLIRVVSASGLDAATAGLFTLNGQAASPAPSNRAAARNTSHTAGGPRGPGASAGARTGT